MEIPLLKDIVIILGLSMVALFLGNRLKIPTIVGYLLTGMVSGPAGFALVKAVHEVEVMAEIGEVLVVAPDSPQSGMGHAITVGNTLRLSETKTFNGIKSYQCSGTPVDCVKLAKHYVLKDRKPDLLVSGVNHGPNTSISVVYSGTMAAALEAAIDDIPAIGFSVCDYSPSAKFEHVSEYLDQTEQFVIPMARKVNADMLIELNDLVARRRQLLMALNENQ